VLAGSERVRSGRIVANLEVTTDPTN